LANVSIQPPARKKSKAHSENSETPIYETELEQATDAVMALEDAYVFFPLVLHDL
jgi:hypothetical protein